MGRPKKPKQPKPTSKEYRRTRREMQFWQLLASAFDALKLRNRFLDSGDERRTHAYSRGLQDAMAQAMWAWRTVHNGENPTQLKDAISLLSCIASQNKPLVLPLGRKDLKTHQDLLDELEKLPNHVVRKAKRRVKASIPLKEIIAFRSAIQSISGLPFIEEVAKRMNKTVKEVMALYEEHNRQRRFRKIDIGKEPKTGKEYFIIF